MQSDEERARELCAKVLQRCGYWVDTPDVNSADHISDDAAAVAIEALSAARESALREAWVPCSERRPIDDMDVLGWRGGYFFVCSHQEDDDSEDGVGIWFDENGGGLGAIEQPTHWMPLPPPPPPTKGTT